MIIAAGIDLGGTKSEVQLFSKDWEMVTHQRIETPKTYDGLVTAVGSQVRWAKEQAGRSIPIGIGAAGLIDAQGRAFTANLPAKGRTLPHDIASTADHPVTYVNDCRALALSEAVFGAGRDIPRVMALILGTGVGGGVAQNGKLWQGLTGCGGEFGHSSASAAILAHYELPLFSCGCGRSACIESYISGPGLVRIALAKTGRTLSTHDIAQLKNTDPDIAAVWQIWVELTADLLLSLVFSIDPNIVVLAGGLSQIQGVCDDLHTQLQSSQLSGFDVPRIVTAQGGDASGARGAALAAWQGGSDDHH